MIRLLIVDDSALMRRLLSEIFEDETEFSVVAARDGIEALALIDKDKPDVVILDIHMPRMDGLTCLDRIMVENPCPVIMFSSLARDGAAETLAALALGAVDFVEKPTGAISLKLGEFAPHLIDKVRTASVARVRLSHRLTERIRSKTAPAAAFAADTKRVSTARQPMDPPVYPSRQADTDSQRLVLVGSSTGGPPALDALLEPLPDSFPWPIVIAQHMPARFTSALADRLDRLCALTVEEVSQPTCLRPGHVYIARGDADIVISRRGNDILALSAPSHSEHRWHPSVDRLVTTALKTMDPALLVGVLLTGMGDDGAQAMTRLRGEGGITIAESKDSAVVWGMPGALVNAGGASFVDPVDVIFSRLLWLAGPI